MLIRIIIQCVSDHKRYLVILPLQNIHNEHNCDHDQGQNKVAWQSVSVASWQSQFKYIAPYLSAIYQNQTWSKTFNFQPETARNMSILNQNNFTIAIWSSIVIFSIIEEPNPAEYDTLFYCHCRADSFSLDCSHHKNWVQWMYLNHNHNSKRHITTHYRATNGAKANVIKVNRTMLNVSFIDGYCLLINLRKVSCCISRLRLPKILWFVDMYWWCWCGAPGWTFTSYLGLKLAVSASQTCVVYLQWWIVYI